MTRRAGCLAGRAAVDAPPAYPVAVTPTHLLVDLAGVLATFDQEPRIAALARLSGLTENDVDERLYGSGFVDAADEGVFDEAEVRAGIVQRLGLDEASAELDAAWMAAFEEDAAVLAVLDTAAAAGVGLLSNNDALVGSLIKTFLPGVAQRCHAVVVSGVTGVRKPAAAAYQAGLAALGVDPERCVFVDDSSSNVAGGLAVGVDSVLFVHAGQLAEDLRRRGFGHPA
jgi:FMN phosphatase YigB (HAD superfamily)